MSFRFHVKNIVRVSEKTINVIIPLRHEIGLICLTFFLNPMKITQAKVPIIILNVVMKIGDYYW